MIFVGAIAIGLRNEFVAGHAQEGIKHALVRDTACAKLRRNHLLAQDRKPFGLGVRIYQETAFPRFNTIYFFWRRMRMSKLTTPFWSRVPTTEMLRVK